MLLAPSIIYAQNVADEEARIYARLQTAQKEFEKLIRESLNGVILLYEKKPELFPGVAPNVKFPERWLEVLDVESLVRHSASMKKKADNLLEGLARQSKNRDKLALLGRAEEAIGSIESNAKGIVGILEKLHLPEHPKIFSWLKLARHDTADDSPYLGEDIKEAEKRLDFLLKTVTNVAAHMADLGEKSDINGYLIDDCGQIYLSPRLEAYALLKGLLAKRADIYEKDKKETLKKITELFVVAGDEIEKKLRNIYHGAHISETLRAWLKEGIKK